MPSSSFCHSLTKGLYISSGDLMDCRSIHICYLPNGLLLSASLYSVSFRRALHSSSSGVTSGGMSPSMTWIFFCKIKLFHSFRLIVQMFIYTGTSHKGHPKDEGYMSAYGRLKKKKTVRAYNAPDMSLRASKTTYDCIIHHRVVGCCFLHIN